MSNRHSIRIFLASPKDTAEARQGVADVVETIAHDPAYRERVEIELRRWDDPNRPVPLSFRRNPQADVVEYTGDPSDCDLLVALFRHVFGSPLPEKDEGRDYGLSPDGDPWTGTEWEISQALQAGREVWIWRDKTEWIADSGWSRQERDARYQQYNRVLDFIDECKDETGTIRRGVLEYGSAEQLKKELDGRLRAWISKRRASAPLPPTSPTAGVAPASLLEQSLRAYLDDRLASEFADRVERYVPMAGLARESRSPHNGRRDLRFAPRLDYCARDGAGFYGEAVPHDDVLTVYRGLPAGRQARLAVLGEPGAGKSFSLERLFCALAEEVLLQPDGARRPAPLLLRLGDWTTPDQSLEQFLAAHLHEAGQPALAGQWQVLRRERPLVLLLDAFNEIPVGQRAAKARQVQAMAGDTRWAAVIVSCRERDFTQELLLPFDTLTLQPLTPPQVLAYLERWEGGAEPDAAAHERAAAQFWRLAAGDEADAARAVWHTWQQAGADFSLFWCAEDVPKQDPDVNSKTSWPDDQLWRRIRHNPRSLLRLAGSPFWLAMLVERGLIGSALLEDRLSLVDEFLSSAHDDGARLYRDRRQTPEQIPDRSVWTAALQALALALQQGAAADRVRRAADARERDSAADDETGAQTRLPRAQVLALLSAEMLEFSIGVQVLKESAGQVHFHHQLLQEALSARALLAACTADPDGARAFWPATHWWARNGWEVVAEMAAESLGDDPAAAVALVRWLAVAQPEVAAQVWQSLGAPALSEACRDELRQAWLPGMTDPGLWPRPEARAAIGRAMAVFDLDNRPGIGLRPDGLPDIDWVEFNDRLPFIYQEAEHPGLPPFALSRYLVTHRQFQAFVEAPDGFADRRWWTDFEDQYATAPRSVWWPEPNCPREKVTWFEALAFCRWLSARLGEDIRLPSERQWERAARGRDGWQYPSAARNYPVGHSNGNESQIEGGTYLQRTCAVGLYPQGATREGGLLDMTGNVWEWCSDAIRPKDEVNGVVTTVGRVLRGGSWLNDFEGLCASFRGVTPPDGGNDLIGFRVCRASPIF
ncbi:hypothetical protein MASR2M32_30440 [Sphaerotilus sulfidivorans]